MVEDGGDTIKIKPEELAKFDLPLPNKADLNDDRKREALLAAAQDARDLRLEDDPPYLPDFEIGEAKSWPGRRCRRRDSSPAIRGCGSRW